MGDGAIPVRGTPPSGALWERVGDAWFHDLVARFYAGVQDDPVLRPMYPAELDDSRRHLAQFLIQYWGGPTTYSEDRGHPRLRMRHAPFHVDDAARHAWLSHMTAAVRAGGLEPADEAEVLAYFTMAAAHLVNAPS